MKHKRVFGYFEAVFDTIYLCSACAAGIWLLFNAAEKPRMLAGIMALVLACGDAFHLVPRVITVLTGEEERLCRALGFGKFVASISMTIFYIFLWHIGGMLYSPGSEMTWTAVVYLLAALRIILCLFPQNRWYDRKQPVRWGIYRNIPFFLLGVAVSILFWVYRAGIPELRWIWLAILLSFIFYLPVVVWINKSPKLGMMMFPKTCAYLWIIFMFLAI
jgi:hypothetical protein